MIINHNLSAMNAHRQMGINQGDQSKSIEKLSSGLRINRAGDDAAGLSISEKMRGQIRGLQQASRNAQDGVSMIQTAEGALNESQSILQRMRQLSVQAANGTNQAEDREKIADEFTQLQEEITRISNDTEFNKMKLLNGDLSSEATGAAAMDLGVFNTYSTGNIRSMQTGVMSNITTKTGSIAVKEGSVAAKKASVALVKASIQAISETKIGSINTKIESVNKKVQRVNDKIAALSVKINSAGITESAKAAAQGSIEILKGSIATYQTQSIATFEASIKVRTESIKTLEASVKVLTKSIETKTKSVEAKTNSLNKFKNSLSNIEKALSVKKANAEMPTAKKGEEIKFQIGANSGQVIELGIKDMRATALGVNASAININTQSAASNAITKIDEALTAVSAQRAKLGAAQNRLESTIDSTDNSAENLQAAESRIRDVDMAEEMMNYTKSNILSSAAQSMLAQANQAPNNVLQLLQ